MPDHLTYIPIKRLQSTQIKKPWRLPKVQWGYSIPWQKRGKLEKLRKTPQNEWGDADYCVLCRNRLQLGQSVMYHKKINQFYCLRCVI